MVHHNPADQEDAKRAACATFLCSRRLPWLLARLSVHNHVRIACEGTETLAVHAVIRAREERVRVGGRPSVVDWTRALSWTDGTFLLSL